MSSTSAPARAPSARSSSAAASSGLSGAKRKFTLTAQRSGTTLRARPPSIRVADITSRKTCPPERASRGRAPGELHEERPGAVDRVLAVPGAGGVGGAPGEGEGAVDRADAAELQHVVGRLEAEGEIEVAEPAGLLEDPAELVLEVGPLLSRVQDEDEVAEPLLPREPLGELHHHGEAALHVRRAGRDEPPALAPRRAAILVVDGHGVEVAAQREPRAPGGRVRGSVHLHHHRVEDPLDPGEAGAGPRLDVVRERALVPDRREPRAERLGAARQRLCELGHRRLVAPSARPRRAESTPHPWTSKSRRAWLSDTFLSVDGLRRPTMSAHGIW